MCNHSSSDHTADKRKIIGQISRIALPAIISNVSVPLLSLADMAIVGHMGAQKYIGAVAVGGMIFNVLYWPLAFLRMGTSGLTSQAFGRRNDCEAALQLARPLALAFIIGVLLAIAGASVANVALLLMNVSDRVEPLVRIYFETGILGAPAVLAMYVFSGWFLGMQNSRYPMYVAIAQNVVNIAASLLLVYAAKLEIVGIALGMVTAQYFGVFMCIVLWRKSYAHMLSGFDVRRMCDLRELSRFFSVNRDIFLRTLCVVAVMSYFTVAGVSMNDTVLAVNALLMQLFVMFSYFMDGFAYAGEAITGRYVGAHDRDSFVAVAKMLLYVGFVAAAVCTLLYFAGGIEFLSLLTNDASTLQAALHYLPWAAVVPMASFGAFILDGICVGATASRLMLLSSALAAAVFFSIFFALRNVAGNHALWGAFVAYLGVRSTVEAVFYPRLVRLTFVSRPKIPA